MKNKEQKQGGKRKNQRKGPSHDEPAPEKKKKRLEVLYCVVPEVYLRVIPEVQEFSFVVGSSCSQRPRFRPNKGSAHNLGISFESID